MSSPDTTESPSSTPRGIALMTVAMLTIPAVDGIAKYLSADYSPLFVAWARYAVACLAVLPVAVAMHGKQVFPRRDRPAHALRTLFLVSSMTLYFLAIARIELATAITAFFVGPIVAVVLSVAFFGERLTWRKGLSLALGFVGALIMLRPGGAVDPGLLMAFGAGVFFALYMIATRLASRQSDPIRTLAFQCVFGALLLTPQALFAWSTPAVGDLLLFAGLGLFSAASHILSITAFRYADTTTLSPLVYVELIGTATIGYLAFREVPGLATIVGAAFIVAAGLVLLQRRARV
ncbi:DMT family transporter [Oricola indica]|uniref:DMT family transporter n=1 Tax=Oricola indica TaxID=2872591 RepID=UPI001CBFE229|nr:DMT family transporter [Oricola indica]